MEVLWVFARLTSSFFVDAQFLQQIVHHPFHPLPSEDLELLLDLIEVSGCNSLVDELLQDDFIHFFVLVRHGVEELCEEF